MPDATSHDPDSHEIPPRDTPTLSRLAQLREMVAGAEQRMASPNCSDQNFAVLGRLRRDLLAEIDELGGGVKEQKPETALDEFTKRLNARESGAKAPGRAARR